MRWLALLLVSCSAVDATEHAASCAVHPSRWDNGCVQCHVNWTTSNTTSNTEWRCANPYDYTGRCTGGDCSADPITLSCPDDVTLRFFSEGILRVTRGECSQDVPGEFSVEEY